MVKVSSIAKGRSLSHNGARGGLKLFCVWRGNTPGPTVRYLTKINIYVPLQWYLASEPIVLLLFLPLRPPPAKDKRTFAYLYAFF